MNTDVGHTMSQTFRGNQRLTVCISPGPEPEPTLYTHITRRPETQNRNGNMSPNPVNTSSSPGNVSIEEKEPMT